MTCPQRIAETAAQQIKLWKFSQSAQRSDHMTTHLIVDSSFILCVSRTILRVRLGVKNWSRLRSRGGCSKEIPAHRGAAMRLHGERLIGQYRASGLWGEETLLDTFDHFVSTHADRIAVVDPADRAALVGTDPRRLSWFDFGRAVDGLATALQRRGVGTDDVVVAQLPNVWELPALFLAVARLGGVISPVPMQWRKRELRHVAALTGARLYIGADNFKGIDHLGFAEEAAAGTDLVDFVGLSALGGLARTVPNVGKGATRLISADDAFTLCWTSGTELEPKGCPLTHNNWRFLGGILLRLLGIPSGGRLLVTPPLVNMAGVGTSLIPWLLTGGTLSLHHPLNMALLQDQMAEGADFTLLVPALLNMIVKKAESEEDELNIGPFRTIATGSAPPSAHSLEQFQQRWGIEVVNMWGQNEGTVLIAGADDIPDPAMRVDHFPWWGKEGLKWPSGISGIEARLLDEENHQLSEPGTVGELVYRGPNVFPGYYRQPDLNARTFTRDGFFRTGDLFQILDDRYLGFFDRKKDIVIRGGINISAAEIENLVLAHPGVLEAAAVAVPDDVMGERVCLFVVPRDPSSPPDFTEVVSFLARQGIASYKLPERFELVQAIPRNPVGKVLKADLRRLAQSREKS